MLDDTREAQTSLPYNYPSKWLDEDSMYRDHISCHRASYVVDVWKCYISKHKNSRDNAYLCLRNLFVN